MQFCVEIDNVIICTNTSSAIAHYRHKRLQFFFESKEKSSTIYSLLLIYLVRVRLLSDNKSLILFLKRIYESGSNRRWIYGETKKYVNQSFYHGITVPSESNTFLYYWHFWFWSCSINLDLSFRSRILKRIIDDAFKILCK